MSAESGSKFRWPFLILFCLLVIAAKVLSSTLEPRPYSLQNLKPAPSVDSIATTVSSALQSESGIIGIGYPQIDSETTKILNLSLADIPSDTHVIVCGKIKIDRAHDDVDLLDPEALDRALASRTTNEKAILVLPTIFVSHRMGKNWVTDFESLNHVHLQSVILSSIALNPAAEEHLSPKCYTSQRSAAGINYDLGCLILNLSRRAQRESLDLSKGWLAVEKESEGETLIAYTLPNSTPEKNPDAK